MDAIYLDHAATTPVHRRVREAMQPFFTERFGNPSSVHALGRAARFAVEESRERVAAVLGCEPGEVVFTSGGTEANNAAISGVLCDDARRGSGLVTSGVEHDSVLRPARAWLGAGHRVEMLRTDRHGHVRAEQVEGAIDRETGLVSLMWVNNELGTVNPVAEIADVCRRHAVPFHTDAVQAVALYSASISTVAPDLLTISAHKFGGPKGVGALLVRSGAPFTASMLGGSQERRRRAGTENVPGLVGLATALEIADEKAEAERGRLRQLQEGLAHGIVERCGDAAHFNTPLGPTTAPHILNVSFQPDGDGVIDGEMLLLALDMAGVMVSSGSACTSGAVEPSHVLEAIALPRSAAAATIRFSMGHSTTRAAIDMALDALTDVLERQGLQVTR